LVLETLIFQQHNHKQALTQNFTNVVNVTQNITNVTVPNSHNVNRLVKDIADLHQCMSQASALFNELYLVAGFKNQFGYTVSSDEIRQAWSILNTTWQAVFFHICEISQPVSQPAM